MTLPDNFNKDLVPRHIAVIMDGNGRWAKKQGFVRAIGHRHGTDATREIVRTCGKLGVEVLTIYVFSSENWKRPAHEVQALMVLLEEMVKKELPDLNKNNVKMVAMGELDKLPEKTKNILLDGIKDTKENTGLILNLAISYGGRNEIIEAVKSITDDLIP